MNPVPEVVLPDGTRVARLGLGTWRMGERRASRAAEVAALQLGIELGMGLVDTAEMYGEGGAEEVVAEAIRGRRDRVFLVSKFYPHNASRKRLRAACEASLGRLGVESIDLYLLHWRGDVPLAETVAELERLVHRGLVRRWGVSNFDVADLEALAAAAGGTRLATNQVLYNLARRGIEHDLLAWCRERRIPTMAYSPIEQGRILADAALGAVAKRLRATPAQVALAWCLRQPDVLVIPKASSAVHVRENRAAASLALDAEALAALDRAFPPPRAKRPLQML